MSLCNKNWKWANDRIGRCLGYLHAEADPDYNITLSQILLRKTVGVWKNVEFCTSEAIISASITARVSPHLSICWASCCYTCCSFRLGLTSSRSLRTTLRSVTARSIRSSTRDSTTTSDVVSCIRPFYVNSSFLVKVKTHLKHNVFVNCQNKPRENCLFSACAISGVVNSW